MAGDLPKLIAIALILVLAGCAGNNGEKQGNPSLSEIDPTQGSTPPVDSLFPEAPGAGIFIDTIIDKMHIQVFCTGQGTELENEDQRPLFEEKNYAMVPLLAVVDQCTSAIGIYSGCSNESHPIITDSDDRIISTKGVWIRTSTTFLLMLDWEIGFNGLVGFKIENGCPHWLIRCGKEGVNKYVESLDVYDCLYDSQREEFFCPSSRQQSEGIVFRVSAGGGCLGRKDSVKFGVHPESMPDTAYYLRLLEFVRGK